MSLCLLAKMAWNPHFDIMFLGSGHKRAACSTRNKSENNHIIEGDHDSREKLSRCGIEVVKVRKGNDRDS
jgi:hypothetical protein